MLTTQNLITIIEALHSSTNIGSIELSKARQLAHRFPDVERYAEDVRHLQMLQDNEAEAMRAVELIAIELGPHIEEAVSRGVYGAGGFIRVARGMDA